ncbi:MAG: hypothetical protein NZ523_01550, partial [Elioraea sp.]|nr:hypothetical protein [Elioraea sp.]
MKLLANLRVMPKALIAVGVLATAGIGAGVLAIQRLLESDVAYSDRLRTAPLAMIAMARANRHRSEDQRLVSRGILAANDSEEGIVVARNRAEALPRFPGRIEEAKRSEPAFAVASDQRRGAGARADRGTCACRRRRLAERSA